MENKEILIPKIIDQMRSLCSEQKPFSDVMHYLVDSVPQNQNNSITLLLYVREAFLLSLKEASPICGWKPDGSGEISDDRLNELITSAIHDNEPKWRSSFL